MSARTRTLREAEIGNELRKASFTVEQRTWTGTPEAVQSWWEQPLNDLVGPRIVKVSPAKFRTVGFNDLVQLSNLSELECLLFSCSAVDDFSPLARLSKLRELCIVDFTSADPIEASTDSSGVARDSNPLVFRLYLNSNLRELSISSERVIDLQSLERLHHLERLVVRCQSVVNPAALGKLRRLKSLVIVDIDDLSAVSQLGELEALEVGGAQLRDLAPLSGLPKLEKLSLWKSQVADIAPLAGMKRLRELSLAKSPIADLTPLESLGHLSGLWLFDMPVADLKSLSQLKTLETLHLGDTLVTSIQPLAETRNLHYLNLANSAVVDFSPLASLSDLRVLNLSGTNLADIAPLVGLKQLENADIRRSAIDNEQYKSLRQALPLCDIHWD